MKFLKCIFTLIILAAVLAGGAAAYLYHEAQELNEESKDFVDTALQAITAGWSVDAFYQYADSEAFPRVEGQEDNVVKLFGILQTLGALKTIDGTQGNATAIVALDPAKDIALVANYETKAAFEKGEATITMTIAKKAGAWKMIQFNINSPALVVNQEPAPAPAPEEIPAEPIEPEEGE